MMHDFVFSIVAEKPGRYPLTFTPGKRVAGQYIPIGASYTVFVDVFDSVNIPNQLEIGSIFVMMGDHPVHVSIQGKELGVTPVRSAGLIPGSYLVKLNGENFPDQLLEIVVAAGKVTELTIDSITHQESVLSKPAPMRHQDTRMDSAGFLDTFFFLAFFVGLTLFAGYVTFSIAGRVKKSRKKEDDSSSPFFSTSEDIPVLPSETRVSLQKRTDVIFDPMFSSWNEGESGDIKVRTTNFGSRPVIIEGQTIPQGESRYILIRIPAGKPGDQKVTRKLIFMDDAGREFSETLVLRYQILPNEPKINWVFSGFVHDASKISAQINITNLSPFPIICTKREIPPGTTGDIELLMNEAEKDEPEIQRMLDIWYLDERKKEISVLIPWNRGVELTERKKYDDALNYYQTLFSHESGSADLWIQRGQVLTFLKRNNESKESYRQALAINPESESATKLLTHYECPSAGTFFSDSLSSTVIHFPDELKDVYCPVSYMGDDQTGSLFLVERIEDISPRMVKVLKEIKIDISSFGSLCESWKSLHYPHILRLTHWKTDPVLHIETDPPEGVMQKGTKVYSLAQLQVPIPRRAVAKIGLGLVRGVKYLHHRNLCHHNLDPSIIYLDKDLHVRIGGFENRSSHMGKECSDICWLLAPEQIDPGRFGTSDKATDIYQIGAVLYLLLTGTRVYGAHDKGNESQVSDQFVSEDHALLPSTFRPDLISFDPIIERSLARDKNERYTVIEELEADLESILFPK
jgi:tetratricopeptide (TPR) repeat protein